MAKLNFDEFTERQQQIWVMRFRYRWRLKQIAVELGMSHQSVAQTICRARLRAGVPRAHKISVIRTKPQLARPGSFQSIFDH